VPKAASSEGDALVWPMPVADTDILWLEPDAEVPPKLEGRPAPAAPIVKRDPASGISLAQLIGANVSMEWHDAVAIVLQLADTVFKDSGRLPTGSLPPLGAIRLESDGQLQLQIQPNGPESLTAGFGRVLQALLQDKPTPANLRLLAWRTTSDAGASLTPDEITGELVRWERPGRIRKLTDLYERARAAGPVAAPVQLAPVPREVPAPVVVEPPLTPAPAPEAVAPSRSRRSVVMMAAAALVCVAIGGTGAWLLGGPGADANAPVAKVASTPVPPQDSAEPQAHGRPGRRSSRGTPPSEAHAASPSTAGNGAPRQRTRQSPPAVATPAPQATPSAAQAESDRSVNSPSLDNSIANLAAPTAVPAPIGSAIGDRRVYTSADAGVTEAILVKPYLPLRPHPDIPDTALGVLEVVVDARGLVESVHLRSPANRYREKWWLFTAKDWRFEPARKNGTPVRSLKRILLTDLNIAEPQ